jgi:hypothetical protein
MGLGKDILGGGLAGGIMYEVCQRQHVVRWRGRIFTWSLSRVSQARRLPRLWRRDALARQVVITPSRSVTALIAVSMDLCIDCAGDLQGYEHYEKKKREHEQQGMPPPPMPTQRACQHNCSGIECSF